MLKGITYPSATAALDAYMHDHEGKAPSALPRRFVRPHSDVDRLLLSSGPPQDAAQTQRANATYNSVKQMVEKAYAQLLDASQKKRLQIQREKSVLDESQAVLDNLSSLPGSSVADVTLLNPGSEFTDDLLQPMLVQTHARHQKRGNTSTASQGSVRSKKKAQKPAASGKTSGITPKIKATLDKLQQIRKRKEAVDPNRSQDDLDLLKVSRRKEAIFCRAKPAPVPEVKAVPSWVNDLANTEITSVTGGEDVPMATDQGLQLASYLEQGKRHSMDDSVLLVGKVQDNLAATETLLSSLPPPVTPTHTSTRLDSSAHLRRYVDTLSMTTDDLLLTSPDGKYIYSHHNPGSAGPPARLQQPILQSRPDNTSLLSVDGVNSSLNKPDHYTTDEAEMNTSHQMHDVSIGTRPLGSLLSNAHHRHFIQQLMRDIEDSGSSIISGAGEDVLFTPKKNVSFRDFKDLSTSVVENDNPSELGFLTRVRSLLSTAPNLLDDDLRRTPSPWSDIVPRHTPSPGTDIVLDGDRSWEKAQPSLKPPVYMRDQGRGTPSLNTGKKDTIVGQFLEECLSSAVEEPPTLTRQPQPGSMEALKNILFTVQTMVPSSGEEDAQTSSSEQMDRLLALYPSDSEAGVNTGGAANILMNVTKNSVPADLRHLLSNSFENEQQNTESLEKAMEHLSVLKSLVDSKKPDG